VTFRLINDNLPCFARYLGGEFNDRGANLTWVCWLVPLAVCELILQSNRILAKS
jgi:hypothetical protein